MNDVFKQHQELIKELKKVTKQLEEVKTGHLDEDGVKLFERLDELLHQLVRLEVKIQLDEQDIIDELQQQGKQNIISHREREL